jgi:glycosyltransferase involved in cell wall biosynthesis
MTSSSSHDFLKILHTEAAMTFGGQEHRIYKEMLAMRERGHYLEAVCQPGAHLIPRLRDRGFEVHEVAMTGLNNFIAGVRKIRQIIRRGKFDVVNTHSRTDTLIGALAGRLERTPLIVRTRHLGKPPGSLLSYTILPHRVIAISKYVQEQLLGKGISKEKIGLVYTAVEQPDITVTSSIRQELGIPPEGIIIGSIGHMRIQKGHDKLIAAAVPILKAMPNVYLVIAGRGEPLLSYLKAQVKKQKLERQIHLLGQRNDIPNLLSGFDIFALATEAEALGTAYIEASSYGLPLVGTEVGGVPEIIEHGSNGALFPVRDGLALGIILRAMISNSQFRQAMGDTAKAMFENDPRWKIENMASKTEAIYRKWIQERSLRSLPY